MITFNPLPRRDSYFPRLRRGHGTTHPEARFDKDGQEIRQMTACVEVTCQLNMPKSKNQHHDTAANLRDWCKERGFSDQHIKNSGPMVTMLYATGGR